MRPMKSMQLGHSGKSKEERMSLGEGVEEEEVVMRLVEEEAVDMVMVLQMKR